MHRWMITDPGPGDVLTGRCRACRKRKDFPRIPKLRAGYEGAFRESITPSAAHAEMNARLWDAQRIVYDYTKEH